MNRIYKLLVLLLLMTLSWLPFGVNAGVAAIPGSEEFGVTSMNTFGGAGDTAGQKVSSAAFKLLTTAKVILNGLAVIYLVYVGTMMIVAYGDEGELSKQKKQLMYALVAFLFVNIPGQVYDIFTADRDTGRDITSAPVTSGSFSAPTSTSSKNIFLSFDFWNSTVENGVLGFVRVAVIGFAVFYFTLAGFKLLVSGGNEDKRKIAKSQALYGFLALVFLGVIQAWVSIVYGGDISGKGQSLFATLSNLALFFAGPTAIFFLTLGAWYYITSTGDEEKAKKGKSIVINTFIAVIILIASYTFLKDLADFTV